MDKIETKLRKKTKTIRIQSVQKVTFKENTHPIPFIQASLKSPFKRFQEACHITSPRSFLGISSHPQTFTQSSSEPSFLYRKSSPQLGPTFHSFLPSLHKSTPSPSLELLMTGEPPACLLHAKCTYAFGKFSSSATRTTFHETLILLCSGEGE